MSQVIKTGASCLSPDKRHDQVVRRKRQACRSHLYLKATPHSLLPTSLCCDIQATVMEQPLFLFRLGETVGGLALLCGGLDRATLTQQVLSAGGHCIRDGH